MDNYIVITPAHNEESYIRFTLDSVVAQTSLPAQWVIVDDGSTDGTASIVRDYADKHPWIKLVKNSPHDTKRQGGGNVVRAFNYGYQALDITDFEFIVKLDADLTLPPNYFEEVGKSFLSEPGIGLCGGFLTAPSNGTWKNEGTASYHLRGAIKAYRKKCFDQIGGLVVTLNWDGIDEMKAMSLG